MRQTLHFLVMTGAVWAMLLSSSSAHPVAQGAMEIVAHPERVTIRARVSVEEAFVAEGFGSGPAAENSEAIWKRHGAYLLQHLHLIVDGVPIAGKLVHFAPPPNPLPSAQIVYDFTYPIPAAAAPPRQISLSEDVLNEFEFAPGNPWEATFNVSLGQAGQPLELARLFTREKPLTLECDWTRPVQAATAAGEVNSRRLAGEYLHHGIMHILTGYDHLLFMAGLVLAVASFLDLLKVVTAFTLAHTVTLTLSVLDIVRLPSQIVEPMIAASIVFVAAQNLFWPAQSRGWSRLLLAFGFGLFHGLGFAGGLLDAMSGLPGLAVTTAIATFSLGVEIGHQAVVLPLFGGLKLLRRSARTIPGATPVLPAARFGSALVCFAGMYYLVAALR